MASSLAAAKLLRCHWGGHPSDFRADSMVFENHVRGNVQAEHIFFEMYLNAPQSGKNWLVNEGGSQGSQKPAHIVSKRYTE